MGSWLILVTGIGLAASAVLVILSVRAGRQHPVHRVPWIIAIVALCISVVFRLTVTIGTMASSTILDGVPILVGNLAVVVGIVAAFWRPAWTGWVLIASAAVLPTIALLIGLVLGPPAMEPEIAPVMLGFYGIPAVISGILLVVSERWRS